MVNPTPPLPALSGLALNQEFTADEIQDWIVNYLADSLMIDANQIDVGVPFETLALDSASAIEMTGVLEERLGRRIEPTIIYDYPTIEEISDYLAKSI